MALSPSVVAGSSGFGGELRAIWRNGSTRWSCILVLGLGVVAPLANATSLTVADPPNVTANAFTSLNAGVFLALLLGVLGVTGPLRIAAPAGPQFRRAAGTKARAYGLVGAACVPILAGLAAAIALPIMHSRGLAAPASSTVTDYIAREAVAALRLALLGVAVGLVAVGRWRALVALAVFMAAEGIAEAYVSFIQVYGPVGALNAFSDPSHQHKLSVGLGSLVALAWGIAALVAATLVAERRPVAENLQRSGQRHRPNANG